MGQKHRGDDNRGRLAAIKAAVLDRDGEEALRLLIWGLSSGRGLKKCFVTEAAA